MTFADTEVSSVDLRAALSGVVRRWWVVLVCVIVAIALGFVQESGIGSDDAKVFVGVKKVYEPVIETDELGVVQVEPSSIVPVPSFDNQLEILQSDETLARLREQTGLNTGVEVTRSEPKFTIVNTVDQLNNTVSFLATGTPSYTYLCYGATRDDCDPMIDAYVAETISMRKESILAGLAGGISLLDGLIESTTTAASTAISPEERAARAAKVVDLTTKRDAMATARGQITGKMILVSEDSWIKGDESTSSPISNYLFAASVGLIVGLLLALQLAALDKRIRHARQIHRLASEVRVLGSPFPRSDTAQATSIAAHILAATDDGRRSAMIVAPDSESTSFAHEVLKIAPRANGVVLSGVNEGALEVLASNSRVIVVLARAGVTTKRELAETLGLVSTGQNQVLGVALVD